MVIQWFVVANIRILLGLIERVACCFIANKACRVLYDDLIVMAQERKGPKLQIVKAELVSRSDMPAAARYDPNDEVIRAEEDSEWLQRAKSAARFYGRAVSDYDDGRVTDEEENTCALETVIEGCTAIVSCVGAVRNSRPLQDWWLTRLLARDVRHWCADATHPYYTQYHTTRKILHLAEREQERRNLAFQANNDNGLAVGENDDDGGVDNGDKDAKSLKRRRQKTILPRRIRLVRLSDLAVTEKAWHLVPVLTNALRSMVFRYHDMADDLVRRSLLLDTVIVRPGELVDEERDDDKMGVHVRVDECQLKNATTTTITTGSLASKSDEDDLTTTRTTPTVRAWSPARVGRVDVAELLSAAALAPWMSADNQTATSVHYTLAVRWSGDEQAMAPYPAQGVKTHGCRKAAKSLQKAIRRRNRRETKMSKPVSAMTTAMTSTTPISRLKPYGVCVAVPLYLTLAILLRNLAKTIMLASQGNNKATSLLPSVALIPNLRPFWKGFVRFVFRRAPAVEYISF